MIIDTIYTEITNQCNLNCNTCYNRSGFNHANVEIPLVELRRIIETFKPFGLRRLLLSGGEPTLHSEFDSILNFAAEYPWLTLGIVTNGTTNNQDLIHAVNSNKNVTLQVSLDGSCEEVNACTRGRGIFSKTVGFINQIHNDLENKPLLKMVVSQNNINDIEDFYCLAINNGFTPEYSFIYKSGNGSEAWENKLLNTEEQWGILQTIRKLNLKYNTDAFLPLCTKQCPFADNELKEKSLSICIKTDGSIQPCQSLYDKQFTVGCIYNFDYDSFANKMQNIFDLAHKRIFVDLGCKSCFLKEVCGRGCMALAYMLTGDPLGDDGGCQFRKLQFLGYELPKQQEVN